MCCCTQSEQRTAKGVNCSFYMCAPSIHSLTILSTVTKDNDALVHATVSLFAVSSLLNDVYCRVLLVASCCRFVLSLHVLSSGHAVLYATIYHYILLRLLYVPIVDICVNGAFACIVLPLLLFWFIVTLLLLRIAFLLIYVNAVPFVYFCCSSCLRVQSQYCPFWFVVVFLFLLLMSTHDGNFFPIHRPFAALVNLLSARPLLSPHAHSCSYVPFVFGLLLLFCLPARPITTVIFGLLSCCCSCSDFFAIYRQFPFPTCSRILPLYLSLSL
jgi:hypothetical protein